jgi:anti-anti-sigma factor
MSLHPFDVQVRRCGGADILDLSGAINGIADADLNAAYLEAVEAGAAPVALNFSAVEYINSTGIALIVGLLARARTARQRLAVFGLSEHYREIFLPAWRIIWQSRQMRPA